MAKRAVRNNVTIWKNSKVDYLFYDGTIFVDERCEVKFDGNEIVISYKEDDGSYTVYRGNSKEDGHFELSASDVGGRATLHRFTDSRILEGYWEEEGYKGMWRITLQ